MEDAEWSSILPPHPDAAYCLGLQQRLDKASRQGAAADLPASLPQAACLAILRRCERLLKAEPTLLQVDPAGAEVVVVGDLHGQFLDLLTLFNKAGHPSEDRVYVFDGDFVDRGAWGLETLLLLAAWKVAAPHRCFLVRGNHETLYCSWVYGFRLEVLAKYGSGKEGEALFTACKKLFTQLPLGAVVAGSTLVVHGGLPRAPRKRATRSRLSQEGASEGSPLAVATLADISAAYKGGEDPEPKDDNERLAADVLWSDPAAQPGIQLGARPGGVGILFGPDITEGFLRDNGLRLILRGHEGPDARVLRDDMQPMSQGFTLDHDTPCGKLYTVFSAPCYPQFGEQHDNLGAVAVLEAPGYDQPRFVQYAAVPRPPVTPYYEDAQTAPASNSDEQGPSSEDASRGEAAGSGEGSHGVQNGSQGAGGLAAQNGLQHPGSGGGGDGGGSGQEVHQLARDGEQAAGVVGGTGTCRSSGQEPVSKRRKRAESSPLIRQAAAGAAGAAEAAAVGHVEAAEAAAEHAVLAGEAAGAPAVAADAAGQAPSQ